MAGTTEQAVIEALRAHQGGLGDSLSEADKDIIINGLPNEAENSTPINADEFISGVVEAIEKHPVDWILK